MAARILVADGVATDRITLKVRLGSACHEVVTAATAADALRAAQKVQFDLVILGNLGAEGAREVCRQLTADRTTASVPVLMLVSPRDRLAALQAGATATLDPALQDAMLLARVRSLLRESQPGADAALGMAEAAAGFQHLAQPRVTLIADCHATALMWRAQLSPRISARVEICGAEDALTRPAADLYVIAVDLTAEHDGLRLMSELRSRAGSRESAFALVTAAARQDVTAIGLDLGAGEVLADPFADTAAADAAAIALAALLTRKSRLDQRRADMQRQMALSIRDHLTGLYNRRYALPRLAQIAAEAVTRGQTVAVMAIDLDHFKSINDRFGHAAGDTVLAEIADRLQQAVREDGFVARMGGEEFIAVLPSAGCPRALPLAERIRRLIADVPVTLPAESARLHVTASIGVACSNDLAAAPEMASQMLLERADRALLLAKRSGRDRVIISQPEWAA